MGQVKIYGLDKELNLVTEKMSNILHSCVVDGFSFPENKKFHRFFPMSEDHFFYPHDRTEKYTIIEVSIFEGRSMASKKRFINLVYQRFKQELGIEENDIEITIFETPKHNWGIRGVPGDELKLNYNVNI